MIPNFVTGTISAVFTAFNADGSLDHAGQREIVAYLEDTGAVNALFIRSGLGQMYTFSFEDVVALTENVCGYVDGRLPVLVGASGIWDRNANMPPDPGEYFSQAVELSEHAAKCGAAAVMHTTPEFLPAQDEQEAQCLTLDYFVRRDGHRFRHDQRGGDFVSDRVGVRR